MKTEFLQPKFEGARFEEHTLPLEVTRDLASYEALVIELAKHLFLKENPKRKRVPKGFEDEFHLHLERVDHGSTIPVLVAVSSEGQPRFFESFFDDARRLIAMCIAAPKDKLPTNFPRELLTYFNQIGRSLQPTETLTLGDGARLTQEKRKDLVLAVSSSYEREVTLVGTIVEVDFERYSFRMRFNDGSQASIPMPSNFHDKARRYVGRTRSVVTVKGIGSYDSWDRLQKFVAVESLEVQDQYELNSQFERILALEDGWFDGNGVAPEKDLVFFVVSKFLEHYPDALDIPLVVATPQGGLLFEWAVNSASVDFVFPEMDAQFHAFAPTGEDIEQDFELNSDEQWNNFFAFLSKSIGGANVRS
jgi:hypothetical protein